MTKEIITTTTHELKVWPQFFMAIFRNEKPFEVRKNDRDFKVGDHLKLMEYIPELEEYTGNYCMKEITYILEGGAFGIEKGYVVLGIQSRFSVTVNNQ